MNHHRTIDRQRQRRRRRVRKRIRGTAERPRLTVCRSLKHISAQLIDDVTSRTLASASTVESEISKQAAGYGGNCAAAALVGQTLAERAKALGITQAAFDRGHCRYHGRLAALADKAREAGLSM
ncbi:MAG: 50S ribosomal protein L18 [Planctomycetia bacterium]|nr:50S ribosomal protein L18 [Planctomycetia bacterium]